MSSIFRSKPVRVGVPMVGVVLFGYWSLTGVLKGRIQVSQRASGPAGRRAARSECSAKRGANPPSPSHTLTL